MRSSLIIAGLGLVALLSCTDRSQNPVTPEALKIGTPVTVFAASSREKNLDGSFGIDRSETLSLLELTVTVPPTHTPGNLRFSYADPNPRKEFVLADRKAFGTTAEFRTRLKQEIRRQPAQSREVTLFVHGFNSTQVETAFRAAQLSYDIQMPGALMIYSWPSLGNPLGYAYDGDSALFARDGLEDVLRGIRASGISRIVVVAHSMGSLLTMETLRQIEIKDPGWAANNLSGLILISPDLDIDIFRTQMNQFETPPDPFVVFVSGKDKALNLSRRLRGKQRAPRLGNISSIDQVADLPIEIVDTTAYSADAASSHFVAATSPSLLSIFNAVDDVTFTFGPDKRGLEHLLPGNIIRSDRAVEFQLTEPAPRVN
jgi:esterase/lipase superfamily enzyme